MKKRNIAILTAIIAGIVIVHFYGAKLGSLGIFVETFAPGLIRTESWIECLEDAPTAHGYSIYGFLEKRKTEKAIDLALEHIYSDDAYLWLNASTYLGTMQRRESVPLLIKSIRHTAWRSQKERIELLTSITGQDYGDDFVAWKEWYLSSSPEFIPDWDSSLGHSPQTNQSQPVGAGNG